MPAYQFTRRRHLSRHNQDSRWGGHPEVQPGQSLQAILNTANMQGGDTVYLGPYTFYLKSTLTVPSNVTLRGVPNVTRLVVLYDPGDPQYGPVVTINAAARVQDCIIDFDLTQEGRVSGYTLGQDTAVLTKPSGSTTTLSSTDYNSVVKLNGARARLQNCHIPSGVRRAVLVSADKGIVIGNEIDHDSTNNNAAIYCENTVKDCVMSSNICTSASGIISVKTGLDNVVVANLATLVERA